MFLSDKRALECDKVFCVQVFEPYGDAATLSKSQILQQARFSGWHVVPCLCKEKQFEGYRWRHKGDYCPEHYPVNPKPIQDLPPL